MINWFDMPAEGLSNGGLFEVKELEVTENGTYEEKGEMYNKVTVNVEGGGGVTWDTVFEGSVTTQDDDGDISGIIENLTLNGNSIRVTFNGTVYELPKTEHGYGAENESGLDFSTYPLFIVTGEGADSCTLWTPTAGTYTLKIEEPQSGGSSDFSTAKLTLEYIGQVAHAPLYISRIYDNIAITPLIPMAGTFDIVLYKGLAYGILETEDNVSVDGAIEYDDGDLIITGDCTITIS